MTKGQYQAIAGVLLFLLLASSVYRAATLSISMDEAYTYLSFVVPPWKQILTTYSPNHNILYSLLAKASIETFGVSELSLRVPALVGGFLTLVAAIGISRLLLTSRWTRFLFVCLVALNPMIFDYMSEARGYSLALAFYLLGLLRAVPVLVDEAGDYRSRLAGCGALLGLSVAAHLSLGIPIIAFDLIFAALCLCYFRGRAVTSLAWLLVPQAGVAAAIIAGPLLHANREAFIGGYSSILQTLNNFSISCLLHDWDGNGLWTYQINTWTSGWFYSLFRWVFILVIGAAGFVIVANRYKRRDAKSIWLLICTGTLLFSFVALIALHVFGGAPYPFGRFVLYWWPLWAAITCFLMEQFRSGKWLAAFGVLMATQLVLQIDLDHFGWLQYAAGTKQIAAFIRQDSGKQEGREVTISTSGSLFACLDFYRATYSMKNWKLVTSTDVSPGGDYIVMDVFDRPHEMPAGYDIVWQDRLSHAVIGVRHGERH